MKAINPWAILEIDEAATREEIDAALRRLSRIHHPDRQAGASADERRAAEERMAEINYAHTLLTDPDAAAAHKRRIERARAAGHHVEPPRRRDPEPPVRGPQDGVPPAPAPGRAPARPDTVGDRPRDGSGPPATPWVAPRRRRRWFGRR